MSSIKLNIRLSTGTKFPVTLQKSLTETTVLGLKDLIAETQDGCPSERQRLVYKGRILDNDRSLSDYGIIAESTLHLVKARAPAPAPGAASRLQSTPTQVPPSATTAASSTGTSTNPPNPFLFPGGMPPTPANMTPEQMTNMMNSPMMQSMLDNPDMMRTVMEMNPQMRQLMDANPQVREIMNNPELLRQSMQMMRNPQAMQQMMRSQDLAMSQIENMPGGFAALSNMYRDVQEPMMDAMTSQNSSEPAQRSGNSSGSGATGQAMPNPWGTPSASTNTSSTGAPSTSSNPGTIPMANPWGIGGANPLGGNPFAGGVQQPPNMEQTLQMLENPIVNQMMEQMFSNPQMMRQMMDANPMMQQLRQTNPQAAAMMENPEMMRQMMNPQNLRAMMQLQNSFGGMGGMGDMGTPPMGGGLPGGANLDFSGLLNQFQSANLGSVGGAVPPQPQQHPADRFRPQIQSLRDMGFDDEQANLRALVSNHGNLNRAVDMLIAGTVPDHVPGVSDAPAPAPAPSAPSPASEEQSEPKDATEKKND